LGDLTALGDASSHKMSELHKRMSTMTSKSKKILPNLEDMLQGQDAGRKPTAGIC